MSKEPGAIQELMKASRILLPLLASAYALPAVSEPVLVSLANYAFDFPTYGYEITVVGVTRNFIDRLTADDHITIDDEGYTLKTLIDRMGRKDRQQFISFFNDHCVVGFSAKGCSITASGDIELDENMRMIFRMSTVEISKDGDAWSNSSANN